MKIGIPKEIKDSEFRVAITPSGVVELVLDGHSVFVETQAGVGSYFSDDDFVAAGASVLDTADEVWGIADLVLKVKEPIAPEWHRMRKGQTLFTYLHIAADAACAEAILNSGITAIAYETVQDQRGGLPLLAPMSEVAGRLATQVGAYHLMKHSGARGVLMGGVPGVEPAKVAIIGAGVAGVNAATMAVGMQAQVSILDINVGRLREVDALFQGRCQTRMSNSFEVERAVTEADLVIGAVLIPGARAPKIVSNQLVSQMKSGSVLVDIAIDQGGCFEDSRATTHSNPTYRVHDSIFYCVANMPGGVPRTSTFALTNVTLPYVRQIAAAGWRDAVATNATLRPGLNAHEGQLTNDAVGAALGIKVTPIEELLDLQG